MAKPKIPPQQKQVRFPVPVAGLNTVDNMLAIKPIEGLYLDNIIARPFGLEIRKGWKDHQQIDFTPPALPPAVRSIIPYHGSSVADDALFVSTDETDGPIYDVTAGNTTPLTDVLTWTNAPDAPGECYYTQFANAFGNYLIVVSAGGGVARFDGTTWTEVALGGGAGEISFASGALTLRDLCFVFSWKKRLWFVERNSSRIWYLPVDAIAGVLNVFDFGAQLINGGSIQFGANWTYDAGAGIDDNLIVITSKGDMLIYQGTDPSDATKFQIKGTWYIGRIPSGRRGFAQMGGDLMLVTEFGVVSVSDFVSGRITAPTGQSSFAPKINPSIARAVSNSIDEDYWHITVVPKEEIVVLANPYISPMWNRQQHWMMNGLTRAWTTCTNMDILCSCTFQGEFYYGTSDGWVKKGFTGYRDGDNFDSSVLGQLVTGRMITGFYDFETGSSNKRATRVRLLGLAEGDISYHIVVRNEYKFRELFGVSDPVPGGSSVWDTAIWDAALWADALRTFDDWYGVAGFGKRLSVQLAIRGTAGTTLTDYEVTYQDGLGL